MNPRIFISRFLPFLPRLVALALGSEKGEEPSGESLRLIQICFAKSSTKIPSIRRSASSDFIITFLSSASPNKRVPRQRLLLSNWECQFDYCAATGIALDSGRTAVEIDNRLHQSQTEACAIGTSR
jgi:hypothetical protein